MDVASDLASDGFGHWLAGLIDGEGCFTITPNRPGYICRLALSLRADDSAALHAVHLRTGLGKVIVRSPGGGNRKPQAMWRVQTKADCARLVAILDRFPLRAKKARDFAIWREAVAVMSAMQPVHSSHWQRRALDWARVAELKERLTKEREYRDEHLRHPPLASGASSSAGSRSGPLHG